MMLDDGIDIANYEVGYIRDSVEYSILYTDNIQEATNAYENAVQQYAPNNTDHHVIVYLYDVDKQCNLNYYNNYNEI